jgi:hypothetical protein
MPKPGYKQSPSHIAKLRKAHTGRRDPDAKGWDQRGYHVVSDGETEVLQHRAVVEKRLGRKLRRDEVVHHGDGKRGDNAVANLKPMSKGRNTALSNKKRAGKK